MANFFFTKLYKTVLIPTKQVLEFNKFNQTSDHGNAGPGPGSDVSIMWLARTMFYANHFFVVLLVAAIIR